MEIFLVCILPIFLCIFLYALYLKNDDGFSFYELILSYDEDGDVPPMPLFFCWILPGINWCSFLFLVIMVIHKYSKVFTNVDKFMSKRRFKKLTKKEQLAEEFGEDFVDYMEKHGKI